MIEHADIVIAGGGPAGAALALMLAQQGTPPLLLEAEATPAAGHDPRTLALSWGSRVLLEAAGAWDATLGADPIETIHVSQQDGFGRAVLTAADAGLPALGYVVRHALLVSRLRTALQDAGVTVVTGARVQRVRPGAGFACLDVAIGTETRLVTSRLAVAADGGRQDINPDVARRRRDYGQHALVGHVRAARRPAATAFERFTPHGPVALLPSGEGYALVWTDRPETVAELAQLPEAAFLERLRGTIGSRAGELTGVSARATWPVELRRARPRADGHRVLIGNAAQTLHPVAGQGFNLALRDARDLAATVAAHPAEALGGAVMLRDYLGRRARDRAAAALVTDGLVRLFSTDARPLALLRGAGLAALELCAPARRRLADRMIFGAPRGAEAGHV